MTLRLVDHGWEQELRDGLAAGGGSCQLTCPFIKEPVIRRLLHGVPVHSVRVVTRFSLADFARGVSDVGALRAIVEAGGAVRGLRGLHAKVFVFSDVLAAVTSANLTSQALSRNAEFGCVSDDVEFVAACRAYVGRLWDISGPTVTLDQLEEWEAIVTEVLARGGGPDPLSGLPDFGSTSTPLPPMPVPDGPAAPVTSTTGWPAESHQAFVKLFGQGDDRAAPTASVLSEIAGAGCHWAGTYPKGRRPRSVRTGDTLFMGRMTHSPHDTLIFGRAIGLEHVDGRDVATPEEIAARPWKVDWPNYIRVHDGEWIAGRLMDGVSLNTLMVELGSSAFASTEANAKAGTGNTNPRLSLRQQPAVRLSPEAFAWLTERFEHALDAHGRVPAADLRRLDWPDRVGWAG
jgi:hypothetical protein